jgi:hypothetical protein
MQSKDLRIGNLVNYIEDNEIFIVSGILSKTIDAENSMESCRLDIEAFEPIILNKEWLLKFGALVKKDLSMHKSEIYYFPKLDISYCLFYADFRNDYGMYVEYTDSPIESDENKLYPVSFGIKYVHELQNLHFALTGEELELKHESKP